jgi:hypothetical protein
VLAQAERISEEIGALATAVEWLDPTEWRMVSTIWLHGCFANVPPHFNLWPIGGTCGKTPMPVQNSSP